MNGFCNLYDELRSLKTDQDSYKKIKKEDVVDYLILSLKANKCADTLMKLQADTILRSTNELLKQSEELRSIRNINSTVLQPQPPAPKPDYNFSAAVKSVPTIVMKKTSDGDDLSRPQIDSKMLNALKNVLVSKSRVLDNHKIIIEVPDQANYDAAVDRLGSEFSNFSFEESKKLLPKLTIFNVPLDTTDESLVSAICSKDVFVDDCVSKHKDDFSVINSWDVKNQAGDITNRKVAVKCSPRLRNYIVNKNKGYLYINLSRCKVQDRFYVPQCYHCQKFYHFSSSCPDKQKNPICGKCSSGHATKNCTVHAPKCINCIRHNEKMVNHASFSSECIFRINAQKLLMAKTNYDEEKN